MQWDGGVIPVGLKDSVDVCVTGDSGIEVYQCSFCICLIMALWRGVMLFGISFEAVSQFRNLQLTIFVLKSFADLQRRTVLE